MAYRLFDKIIDVAFTTPSAASIAVGDITPTLNDTGEPNYTFPSQYKYDADMGRKPTSELLDKKVLSRGRIAYIKVTQLQPNGVFSSTVKGQTFTACFNAEGNLPDYEKSSPGVLFWTGVNMDVLVIFFPIDISEEKGETLVIKSPRTGRKPEISLRFKAVPGHLCHDVEVRVSNFMLTVDVRKFTCLSLVAGYAGGTTTTIIAPIFSSYVESPNPDGITVFNCITVGHLNPMLSSRCILVQILGGEVTVGEIIESYISALTNHTEADRVGFEVRNELPDWLLNRKTKLSPNADPEKDRTAGEISHSGYQLLVKLQERLNGIGSSIGRGVHFDVRIYSNRIYIYALDHEGRYLYAGERKGDDVGKGLGRVSGVSPVDIRYTTSCEFNGGTLKLTAPWDPNVLPDSIIRVPARFYSARVVINTLKEEQFTAKKEGDLYRVILMSVDFSTVGNTNQMSLTAVPLRYSDDAKEDIKRAEGDLQAEADKTYTVGEILSTDLEYHVVRIGKKEDKPKSDWSKDLESLQVDDYIIQPADVSVGLAGICKKYYSSMKPFTRAPSELKKVAKGGNIQTDTNPAYGGMLLWPLVAMTSNTLSKKDMTGKVWSSWDDPNKIEAYKVLKMPRISDMSSLINNPAVIEAYKHCYLYCREQKFAVSALTALYNIILYLEGDPPQ